MFGFHRESNMFETSVVYKNKPLIEMPPELKAPEPPPQTRAEARDQNKRRYLPGERLQIKLNKVIEYSKEVLIENQSIVFLHYEGKNLYLNLFNKRFTCNADRCPVLCEYQ